MEKRELIINSVKIIDLNKKGFKSTLPYPLSSREGKQK